MSPRLLDGFSITTHSSLGDDVELYELTRDGATPFERIFSVVAICRKNWTYEWPALGGTRCVAIDPARGWDFIENEIRREAHELALSMYVKNNYLRKSEENIPNRHTNLFGWQGGKGVFWVPLDPKIGPDPSFERYRTPARLIAHGKLVESLAGDYIASKDAHVSTRELMWIEKATRYTIGNASKRDTGEATAEGVAEGMRAVWQRIENKSLAGVSIMVCGVGKVGLPLVRILGLRDRANLSVFDPAMTTPDRVRDHVQVQTAAGAAVEPTDGGSLELDVLGALPATAIMASDVAAMKAGAAILCCASDRAKWLLDELEDGGRKVRRFELLVNLSKDQRPRLILGPANDQVPMGKSSPQRDEVIAALTAAGILFIPDPAVSPGGVIAVSHELGVWTREVVNQDARQIVHSGVDLLFRQAGSAPTTAEIAKAFFQIAGA
jgi:hypothetical protein